MCYICERRFENKGECNRHMIIHHEIEHFQCMKCDQRFFRYTEAQAHVEICRQNDMSDSGSSGDDGEVNPTDNGVTDNDRITNL